MMPAFGRIVPRKVGHWLGLAEGEPEFPDAGREIGCRFEFRSSLTDATYQLAVGIDATKTAERQDWPRSGRGGPCRRAACSEWANEKATATSLSRVPEIARFQVWKLRADWSASPSTLRA